MNTLQQLSILQHMREQIEKKNLPLILEKIYGPKNLWTKNSSNSYAAEHCIEAEMQLGWPFFMSMYTTKQEAILELINCLLLISCVYYELSQTYLRVCLSKLLIPAQFIKVMQWQTSFSFFLS
jgi:hypothetical protein